MLIPNSLAQEEVQLPDWIKNVAGWWSNDMISENEFLNAIEYLVNNNIIPLDAIPCTPFAENSTAVPSWIKNNAGWWATEQITDTAFYTGIKYLIDEQIIFIDNKKIKSQIPLHTVEFSPAWSVNTNQIGYVTSSLFEVYGIIGNCIPAEEYYLWENPIVGLNPNYMEIYNEIAIWNDPAKAVVVYPMFTFFAYDEPGFYTYYRGECDDCTTTKFTDPRPMYTSSGIAHQILTLLGYYTISDIELDKNPSILQEYDKVIMLHNEYVTRAMFDAVTSHPNVIYLYPNALYAEIEVNYVDETITLIRGHDYPPEDPVANGFDWELDNTHPYEYDSECLTMEFYKIKNGWMTNCYPENVLIVDAQVSFDILKTIKDL